MGPSPSRVPRRHGPPIHADISERDVLTLCDDGDLLLLREHIVDTTLRIAIDPRVAHNIAAFQRGAFPTTRLTQLPAWTSCALLLRVGGVLHVLHVNVDGMQLVPFCDRVAERSTRHDTYAIRRLQHGRNDRTASWLRQLAFELSQVLPISWHDTTAEAMALLETTLRVQTTVHNAVQRMLELVGSSLQSDVSPVDRSGMLATAFVVAVYEQLELVEPVAITPSPLLFTPSSFADPLGTDPLSPPAGLLFTPPNALGVAMRLA